MDKIKQIIDELRAQIERYNEKYYSGEPEISDQAFDEMIGRLSDLEQQYPRYASTTSPTQRVGGTPLKKETKRTHPHRMYSLQNSYSPQEVIRFDQRIAKKNAVREYLCELKYDGVAVSITYEQGLLRFGLTRGDGVEGDDITENLRTISTLPHTLGKKFDQRLTVIGEVYMEKKDFEALNQKRKTQGIETLANPRNTVAGSLKLLDSQEVAGRPLKLVIHNAYANGFPPRQSEKMARLQELGFYICPYSKVCKGVSEISSYIATWNADKGGLPFEVDGIVIKLNDTSVQEALGYTAKAPRWAIAYKFPTESALSKLFSIRYQVGRTGAITPVAELKPVLLMGSTIKRASIHNEDFIQKMGLRIGDRVIIEKGGEIIPKIIGIAQSAGKEGEEVVFPTHCPVCQHLLKKEKTISYCSNESHCPAQIKGRIAHFSSKKAANITGLGEETIELLYAHGLLQNIEDIYQLEPNALLKLDRMGQRSVENLIANIAQSKSTPFARILYGIGIRHIGENMAKKLAMHFGNIEALAAANRETLLAIEEVGEKLAQAIENFFKSEAHRQLIRNLKGLGLRFHTENKVALESDLLKGKRFVISGVFEAFSREEVQNQIEALGGLVSKSLSKSTDYLLCGDKAGSSKLKKAEILGITLLSEGEFLKRVTH